MNDRKRLKVLFFRLHQQYHACFYCGCDLTAPDVEITVDHVQPRSIGWIADSLDIPENVVACCVDCNNSKGNKAPSENVLQRLAELNKSLSDENIDKHLVSMLKLPKHSIDIAEKCGIPV